MYKVLATGLAVLCVAACSSQRQPRASCSGHLERINVSVTERAPADPPATSGPESSTP